MDSFADLYETPMKYLDSVNIKALEREIGDMSKALEVLQKQDKQPTQSSEGRKRSVSEDVSKSRIIPDAALQPSPILRPAKAYLKSPELTAGDAGDDAIDEAFEKNFFPVVQYLGYFLRSLLRIKQVCISVQAFTLLDWAISRIPTSYSMQNILFIKLATLKY